MGLISELYRGLPGAEELRKRAEVVSDVLDLEFGVGYQLEYNVWKLKAVLRKKLKHLDSCIERCVQATTQLDNIIFIASGTGVPPPKLPMKSCYVCRRLHMFGLAYCSDCAGAVCAACIPALVAQACEDGRGCGL